MIFKMLFTQLCRLLIPVNCDRCISDDADMEHAGLVSGLLEGLTAAGAESGYADMLRGVLAMREHTYLQALTLLSEGINYLLALHKCSLY